MNKNYRSKCFAVGCMSLFSRQWHTAES